MSRAAQLAAILALSMLLRPGVARAVEFTPGPYQTHDGALLLNAGGDFVEPYFATKALLVAGDAGLDVHRAGEAWIAWMLPRQLKDGRFERFCDKRHKGWKACGHADADDSMLALWLQLLYRMSPPEGLRPEWKQSADRAEAHLFSLRRGRLHVYSISRHNHVGLLMDNAEVYSALREMAEAQRRWGDAAHAQQLSERADDLRHGIAKTFWDSRRRLFRVSTQAGGRWLFYPDAVAQTYVLLAGLSDPGEDAATTWRRWNAAYGEAWLARKEDPHPWGLLALTAAHLGDSATAGCWEYRARGLRHAAVWNILEEAAYQALAARGPAGAAACSEWSRLQ